MRKLWLTAGLAVLLGASGVVIWDFNVSGRDESHAAFIVRVYPGTGKCTGSVMSGGEFLLTAAHCAPKSAVLVDFGGAPYKAADCKRHPRYNEDDPFYDVAVCRLRQPVNIGLGASLETPRDPTTGPVTYVGYGLDGSLFKLFRLTASAGVASGILIDVERGTLLIEGGRVYDGDSGGPVNLANHENARIAGVLSCHQGRSKPRAVNLMDPVNREWVEGCLRDWNTCKSTGTVKPTNPIQLCV